MPTDSRTPNRSFQLDCERPRAASLALVAVLSGLLVGCERRPDFVFEPLPADRSYPWVEADAASHAESRRASAQARAELIIADGVFFGEVQLSLEEERRRRVEVVVDRSRRARVAVEEHGAPIDLNTASASELRALPRVGPAMAARIIEARPFARVDDVLEVRGIGPATFDQWAGRVTVSAPVPSPAEPAESEVYVLVGNDE